MSNYELTKFKAGNTSRTMCADGVPIMLRSRCRPSFLVNSPDRFKRFRMYWPHKHLPCVTKSWVGTITGSFHPMVLDSLRVTTSLTLLKRRRAENVLASLNRDDECNTMGKLNLRLFSTMGMSNVLADMGCVFGFATVPYILSGDNILS